jgi:hypothetical protein
MKGTSKELQKLLELLVLRELPGLRWVLKASGLKALTTRDFIGSPGVFQTPAIDTDLRSRTVPSAFSCGSSGVCVGGG